MGWFSDLFKTKDVVTDTGLPKVKHFNEGQSGVILPKGSLYVPPKEISEPVYAIVKAMKERPSSFKTKVETTIDYYGYSRKIKVVDLKTNQECIILYSKSLVSYSSTGEDYFWSWKWLTADEKQFLKETYEKMRTNKFIRSDKIKKLQLDHKNSVEREAMKAIYK